MKFPNELPQMIVILLEKVIMIENKLGQLTLPSKERTDKMWLKVKDLLISIKYYLLNIN